MVLYFSLLSKLLFCIHFFYYYIFHRFLLYLCVFISFFIYMCLFYLCFTPMCWVRRPKILAQWSPKDQGPLLWAQQLSLAGNQQANQAQNVTSSVKLLQFLSFSLARLPWACMAISFTLPGSAPSREAYLILFPCMHSNVGISLWFVNAEATLLHAHLPCHGRNNTVKSVTPGR